MKEKPDDTRWSLVVRSKGKSPAARAALAELCEIYYAPVHAFIKRWTNSDDSRDLTHEFFSRILQNDALTAADPERGKFRNYLYTAVKHFLQDNQARKNCKKRGGDFPHVALDKILVSDPGAIPPDVEFDRAWACTLIGRCITATSREMEEKGKLEMFETLRPWLSGSSSHGNQTAAADKLGISETAVRVLVHRLRKRLREIVEAEISHTLEPGEDIKSELQHLLGVW